MEFSTEAGRAPGRWKLNSIHIITVQSLFEKFKHASSSLNLLILPFLSPYKMGALNTVINLNLQMLM